jgi:hypothetical protein
VKNRPIAHLQAATGFYFFFGSFENLPEAKSVPLAWLRAFRRGNVFLTFLFLHTHQKRLKYHQSDLYPLVCECPQPAQ